MNIPKASNINTPSFVTIGFVLLLTLPVLEGCNWRATDDDEWVVRVHDHYLSLEELDAAIPHTVSAEDSVKMADAYVSQWLKDHVVLAQAELNLPPELTDFEQQLRDYRNSLVVYAFEKELIKQKLDTVVTDVEISDYYNTNAENFQLKDYIVRVQFIKVPANAPNINEAEEWIVSDDPETVFLLEDYSQQYAEFGYFNEEQWIYFDDLLRRIPVAISDKEQFLSQNKLVKLNEGNYLYILKIIDYQLKDGISPLELVRSDIRNIIINKRKREFILQMRKDLLESATKNNDIEYNH